MKTRIKKFSDIRLADVPVVGGKNASLGEMFSQLQQVGVLVPDGFATTAEAFEEFLDQNSLRLPLQQLMSKLDRSGYKNLREIGAAARDLLKSATLPIELANELTLAYEQLTGNSETEVAVRSSATAEDLPQASFAGQHESFLNIRGAAAVLEAVKKCFISLYTDRAIKYREDNGFAHEKVLLSAGVQRMVRSDLACSGVGFTLEPESGFRDVVHLSGVWGLGENMVQGTVTPDEFLVFKPTLLQGKKAIIQKKLGEKALTMVYDAAGMQGVINTPTSLQRQRQFVLDDEEVMKIASWAVKIEEHYGHPMDIEWAKDGLTSELFIIQARPETVHSRENPLLLKEFRLLEKGTALTSGQAIGSGISVGIARVLASPADSNRLQPGEIVVTGMTSPDWDPILKNAGAIVTDKGGRTSHASIVARELGVPAIVGCQDATNTIRDGDLITVSCCEGKNGIVYKGRLKYQETSLDFSKAKKPEHTKVMLITGDPEQAFRLSFYPNDGIGLLRMEFIITHVVKVHPMALVNFDSLKDAGDIKTIEELTSQYQDKKQYFIDKLSQGIATLAAAFYPKDVIVRMSDFKTNEYASLIGGRDFEPVEENPMLGFRGASRYYHDRYREGFRLECEAIRVVRDEMGLTNVKTMIPFCRTLDEGRRVLETMKLFGLAKGRNGLEIYVMAEIPSNVILGEQFARLFDGFSIGSNDLTQLLLGIDRDSAIVSPLFSEQNEAVKEMIHSIIAKAKKAGVKIGLCGQAPSDDPSFAGFLVEQGIDSISFNPDALLQGLRNICEAEQRLSKQEKLSNAASLAKGENSKV